MKDAWQALGLIENDGWRPRVILLDLMMPRMNGWEFLDRLKRSEVLRRIAVVVLSAADDPRMEELTADAVLKKPIRLDLLVGALKPPFSPPSKPADRLTG